MPGPEHQGQIDERWNEQQTINQAVVMLPQHDRCHQQWPGDGPCLVQRFVQAESPAVAAQALPGMRQQGVARRVAQAFANAFKHEQQGGLGPGVGQRQCRH